MKKIFCVCIALVFVLSLVSCGEEKQEPLHAEFATEEEYIAFAREHGEKDVVLYIPVNLPASYSLQKIVYDEENGIETVYSDGFQTATYWKHPCADPTAVLEDYPFPDYTVKLVGEREYRYKVFQEETPDGFSVVYEVACVCDGNLFVAMIPAIGSSEQVLSMAVLTQMIAFDQ